MKKILMYAGMISAMLIAAGNQTKAQNWLTAGNGGSSTQALGTNAGTGTNFDLRLKTNNVTRMTIKQNGKVGIGVATPKAKLDVQGAQGATDTIVIKAISKKANFTVDHPTIYGESVSTPGFGIGVIGVGNFFGVAGIGGLIGVDGEASEAGNTLQLTGTQGLSFGGDISVGVYGSSTGALNNYGVYGDQQDTTVADYALVGIGDVFGWRFFQASDRKLKKNIETYSGALAKINQLVTSIYTFDHAKYPGMALPGGKQIGFMADNVEQVFPELIKTGDLPAGATRDARGKRTYHQIENVKAVNYMGLIPVLAEAIKEQKAIVDAKDAVIADLNARLTALEAKVSETSSAKLSSVSSTASSLEQNNPNPFNQSTQIRYSVPANYNTAQIIITSVDGKSVRTYNVTGSGKGQITLNANELSAGTYNYSLNVDGKTVDTKSLVLTK